MKIEFDAKRDLVYLRLADGDAPVIRTETIAPGVFADFDVDGNLLGIEVLDASTVMGPSQRIEVALRPVG